MVGGNFCINNIVGLILIMFRCVDGDLNDCWNGSKFIQD